MKIQFVDLHAQYLNIKTEIDAAITAVMNDTAFVGGSNNKYVRQFEQDFSEYLGVKHIVTCANGTDSLEILLEAYGIGDGDEVLIPALSWISTSESVGRIGAIPIFIDVHPNTLLMDVEKIEEKINSKTKAIMPVHLYGNAVDMESLMLLAEKHKLIVIEDCAQSHGAKYNNKLTGTFGHASSFSFYPGKNLGAYGDAGAIATNSDEIAEKCRMIANHGQLKKHTHLIEGRNSRMDGLHAAVLSVKLRYLDKWNSQRNVNALYYQSKIKNSLIQLPVVNLNASHVYHLFVIRTDKRDALKALYDKFEVETAVHYPTALPFVEAYKKYNYSIEDFPVAFAQTKRILSLPMFPELSTNQMDTIINLINNFN